MLQWCVGTAKSSGRSAPPRPSTGGGTRVRRSVEGYAELFHHSDCSPKQLSPVHAGEVKPHIFNKVEILVFRMKIVKQLLFYFYFNLGNDFTLSKLF